MLKPADTPPAGPRASDERPVGDIVHELIENGKSYARAEIALGKAIASDKARGLALPAILFAAAFLVLQAAVTALAIAVLLALEPLVGPILAGLLAFLIFVALAGGLAWLGVRKAKAGA